jgi:quinol monooxygenase YgiN
MIAIVATIRVRDDMVDDFERTALELERQVAAHEPDCLTYRMARSRTEPLTYRSLEIFRDQAALDAHVAADYFVAAARAMRPCTASESIVEFGDTLADG